jgi:hypothetical protein
MHTYKMNSSTSLFEKNKSKRATWFLNIRFLSADASEKLTRLNEDLLILKLCAMCGRRLVPEKARRGSQSKIFVATSCFHETFWDFHSLYATQFTGPSRICPHKRLESAHDCFSRGIAASVRVLG